MATETTIPSESTMNESIEKKMEDLSIEKIEYAQKEVDSSIPEAEEKEILKEEKTHEVKGNESPDEQQARDVTLAETEIPEDQDSLKVAESETLKEQDSREIADNSATEFSKVQEIPKAKEEDAFEDAPEAIGKETLKAGETPEVAEKESSNEEVVYKDKVPADENVSDLVAEEKSNKEASESAESDREKEVNVAEVREVSIPTVDHRSGAGDESKTEDVPTTVVHETIDGEKPSPRRAGDIFQNVGSKMIQSVQKLKNVISGKSSNGKSSKSTD